MIQWEDKRPKPIRPDTAPKVVAVLCIVALFLLAAAVDGLGELVIPRG